LQVPRKGIYEACSESEKYIRQLVILKEGKIYTIEHINNVVSSHVLEVLGPKVNDLFPEIKDHVYDSDLSEQNHLFRLIRETSICYTKIRMFDFAARSKDKLLGDGLRVQLSRLIIYQNR
jgi:hypothetical protein